MISLSVEFRVFGVKRLKKAPSGQAVANKLLLFFLCSFVLSGGLFFVRLIVPIIRCLAGKLSFGALVLSTPGLILSSALIGLLLTLVLMIPVLYLLGKPRKKPRARTGAHRSN